jgi:hypothetical protein
VTDTQILIADEGGGLPIIETAGDQVRQIGLYGTTGRSTDIAREGNRLYLASYEGLIIVDLSVPARPATLASLGFPGFAYQVAVAGSVAYVGSDLRGENNLQDSKVWAVDVADPARPRILGSVTLVGTHVVSLAVRTTTLYVSTWSGGLRLFDVANPAAPTPLEVPGGISPFTDGLSVSESRLYLGSGEVLDITTPAAPILLGALMLPNARIVDADGTIVYALETVRVPPPDDCFPRRTCQETVYTTLQLVDATVVNSPRLLGRYALDEGFTGIDIQAERAYIMSARGLEIVDVSDPTTPTLRVSSPRSASHSALLANPDLLFLSSYPRGLEILSLTERFAPTWVAVEDSGVLRSADGTIELSFGAGSLGHAAIITQVERLAPSQAIDKKRDVVRSFMVEARTGQGAILERAQQPYIVWVDVDSEQLATTRPGIAYWDEAGWVDLAPCTACTTGPGQIAVQTDRFGELALLGDAPTPPSHPTPPSQPTPPATSWRVYLPITRSGNTSFIPTS